MPPTPISGTEKMADAEDVERQNAIEQDRDHVEQPAIKIEIVEVEHGLIGQAAGVISEDELAVAMLHQFVIGDGVIVESQQDDNGERGESGKRKQIVDIGARQPR